MHFSVYCSLLADQLRPSVWNILSTAKTVGDGPIVMLLWETYPGLWEIYGKSYPGFSGDPSPSPAPYDHLFPQTSQNLHRKLRANGIRHKEGLY